MINAFRRFLIRFGKALPFILCAIVLVSYIESGTSLITCEYLIYEDGVILNTPISFWIADKFEYDILTLFAATILSVSIQTCVWNKIALAYLFFQLLLKQWLMTVELYPEQIAAITTINIIVCAWLCWKGVQMLK